MSEYEERRKDYPEMLRLLTSMDKNLALLTQSSEIQTKAFNAHIIEDKEISTALRKQIEWHSRVIYMGMGALMLLKIFWNK